MANLVIVESPSKASTIKGYLGSNYKVVASVGHVRDLPKSTLGVDIENHFQAHYINIRGKGDLIKEIRKEAKAAGKVFLATDPDREGEAISWHLANALGIPVEQVQRVTFNEITKSVVKASIKQPRPLDMNLNGTQYRLTTIAVATSGLDDNGKSLIGRKADVKGPLEESFATSWSPAGVKALEIHVE